jgi:hypothetical protein
MAMAAIKLLRRILYKYLFDWINFSSDFFMAILLKNSNIGRPSQEEIDLESRHGNFVQTRCK